MEIFQFRVVHLHLGTHKVTHDGQLAGSGFECTQAHRSRHQHDFLRFNRCHSKHRQENTAVIDYLNYKPQRSSDVAVGPYNDNNIADSADHLRVRSTNHHTCETACVDFCNWAHSD